MWPKLMQHWKERKWKMSDGRKQKRHEDFLMPR